MELSYIKLTDGRVPYYLCKIKGADLIKMCYVARRGQSEEEGAVQRILNTRRVSSISRFLQNGGFFPTNIILNITSSDNIVVNESALIVSDSESVAQVLDGQHRIAGMRDAIKTTPNVGEIEFPCLIAVGLSTEQCAQIFISINTEQKNVPKSLIYDLYGLVDMQDRDISLDRGHDIAVALNEESDSPYRSFIKFPGISRVKGGIQLSTFVNKLRPLVKRDGEFDKYRLSTLEYQIKILKNYFEALKYYYDKKWTEGTNPFMYASGYSAAIEVLCSDILPRCFASNDYTIDKFKSIVVFQQDTLPKQSDVKGYSGELAVNHFVQVLKDAIVPNTMNENNIRL
jgi:DNA sulfur modification protein DndB